MERVSMGVRGARELLCLLCNITSSVMKPKSTAKAKIKIRPTAPPPEAKRKRGVTLERG